MQRKLVREQQGQGKWLGERDRNFFLPGRRRASSSLWRLALWESRHFGAFTSTKPCECEETVKLLLTHPSFRVCHGTRSMTHGPIESSPRAAWSLVKCFFALSVSLQAALSEVFLLLFNRVHAHSCFTVLLCVSLGRTRRT